MEELSRAEQLEKKHRYWKQHIENWQETGLTQAEYCRRNNFKYHQLVFWKKHLIKTETGVSFVPLNLYDFWDISTQPDSAAFCLVINKHFKGDIRSGLDAQLLRQLIF